GSYKKLFPRILIEKIKNFPIKVPMTATEKKKANKIKVSVKKILGDKKSLKTHIKTIDSLVFDLYEITENDQDYIIKYMNTI
ncbi:MAG: hypothetical protein ACFFDH_16245, partial [Promethearchaeota archaeon]